MHVTVHYFAQLRRAASCTSERVDIAPDETIATLFGRLGTAHGELVRTLLLGTNGVPHPSLLVFIGEQPADRSQPLRDGDEVTILTPMAGG